MAMNLDKLAKALSELAGYKRQSLISQEVFRGRVFANSKTASKYLWLYYSDNDSGSDTISEDAFISHTEKIYSTITDKDQVQLYLKVFSKGKEVMDQSSFMDFLRTAYVLYRSLHKLGNEDDSDTSSSATLQWLETVYKSAVNGIKIAYLGDEVNVWLLLQYHIKTEMSVCFLTNWILTNIPRLVGPMHKYIINQLATGCSQIKSENKDNSTISKSSPASITVKESETGKDKKEGDACSLLIHPVLMWLLQSSLPVKFLSILEKKPENPSVQQNAFKTPEELMQVLAESTSASETWTLLYDSDDQGLSINRFQHHVFNYRGPTLMFIKADNDYLFCVASDIEWRESCHFWGGEDSVLFMVKPEFKVVERGSKLLYANFSIRGYPFGIQVGKNPRSLSIEIKPEFNYVSYKQMPCKLIRFLAWGCAPPEVKMSQNDLRKWEEKQAEKNRKINLNNPEWKDNPDKYLLELAGNYKSYDNQ